MSNKNQKIKENDNESNANKLRRSARHNKKRKREEPDTDVNSPVSTGVTLRSRNKQSKMVDSSDNDDGSIKSSTVTSRPCRSSRHASTTTSNMHHVDKNDPSDKEECSEDEEDSESESGESVLEVPKHRYPLRKRKTDEEEHSDEEKGYTFRDRKKALRQVHNVSGDPPLRHNARQRNHFDSYYGIKRRPNKHHGKRHRRRNRIYDSSDSDNDDSSSSSSDDDEFRRKEIKRMRQELDSIQPINSKPNGKKSHDAKSAVSRRHRFNHDRDASKADANPIEVDSTVSWQDVGGLNHHVKTVKEMVMLPLMYPEIFETMSIKAPRGVIFAGPPGCGKTLVARALANSCSNIGNGQHVSFFMRKGADCLSKWVGEAERQLRLLFDQARLHQPSIIFFDEIDGLAPVRSAKQDQIHASIVSTLLALMDGLDDRGQVVVIGATNRIDNIDPALRRPGRFDRELTFKLPSREDRVSILNIHCSKFTPPVSSSTIEDLAGKTTGYCGADIKSLCTEASLAAVRRRYPQIYNSDVKLLIDTSQIKVGLSDFRSALQLITPASHRSSSVLTSPLPPYMNHILGKSLSGLSTKLHSEKHFCDAGASTIFQPRVLISGKGNIGQSELGKALLHEIENKKQSVYVLSLSMIELFKDAEGGGVENIMVRKFLEARKNAPSVVYIPQIHEWWQMTSYAMKITLRSLLNDLPPSLPVLFLASMNSLEIIDNNDDPFSPLDLFDSVDIMNVDSPTLLEQREYLLASALDVADQILTQKVLKCFAESNDDEGPEVLPIAPKSDNSAVISKKKEENEHSLRELRIFLRVVLYELQKERKFKPFWDLVSEEEVPDYYKLIKDPMALSIVQDKIDDKGYLRIDPFISDISLIVKNCIQYNPQDKRGKQLIHTAKNMLDLVESMVHRFKEKVGYNLFDDCAAIMEELESTTDDTVSNGEAYPPKTPANERNTPNSAATSISKAVSTKPPATKDVSSSIMSLSELGNTTRRGSLDISDDDTHKLNNNIDPEQMKELKSKINSMVVTVIDRLTDGSIEFTFDSLRHFQARMTNILSEEISGLCDDYLGNKTDLTSDMNGRIKKIVSSLILN